MNTGITTILKRLTAALLVPALIFTMCACSKNDGSSVSADISSSAEEYTTDDENSSSIFSFLHKNGSDKNDDKESTMHVGAEGYGFLDVPDTWKEFTDPDVSSVSGLDVKQYSDAEGKMIITLNYASDPQVDAKSAASSCWTQMEQEGAENIQGSTVKLDGCTAYQVYGYYTSDDVMLVIWVFTDSDGLLHYISAEGPIDNVMDSVSIVEDTYSVK
jgi:hypothetical protein